MGGNACHILLIGGSRSGKTFWIVRAIVMRALKCAGSTHAILRFRFNHLKASIIADTFPKVMKLCFPNVSYTLNKSDWYFELPNGSRIWLGGLDDKDRTEKILGQEHSTLYFNECSQISFAARNKALTRLAQNMGLTPRAYYDENPPTTAHWTYHVFFLHQDPVSRLPLMHPENFVKLQMNPEDNKANLTDEYLELLDSLPERERKRFKEGLFQNATPGALWSIDSLEQARYPEVTREELNEVVIAIDPSGCSGPEDKRSDEIGIVACGKTFAGVGLVLEDASGRYSPNGWAKAALFLYDKWMADRIVAETNFGGDMVVAVIHSERQEANVKKVTASRGKAQRADPIASLYTRGLCKHAGEFPEIEEQMCEFTNAGFQGARSPDRADAAIWGLTDLMIGAAEAGWLELAERAASGGGSSSSSAVRALGNNAGAVQALTRKRLMKAPAHFQGSISVRDGTEYFPDASKMIAARADHIDDLKRAGFVEVVE